MKITIQLDRPLGDHERPFTSTDCVCGIINLNMQQGDAISRITVELSGSLLASVLATATNPLGSSDHAVDNHKLFSLCSTLFPPSDVPISSKGFCLPKGTHTFPFQFSFPILSTCRDTNNWITHPDTTLPPSFKVQAPNNVARGEMKYWLKVKAERPGRFKTDVTEQLELKFMPLDPSLPPPMLQPAYSRSSRNLLSKPVDSSISSLAAARQTDKCTVTLEVTLPSPAIIYIDGIIPLKVFTTVERGSTRLSSPVLLRTLSVILRTEITVSVGPNLSTWPVFHELLNLSELYKELQDSEQLLREPSSNLWRDCVVPDVTPSFSTCTHTQQHFLVITVGFSYSEVGPIQTIKTVINVDVHSGIKPASTARNVRESEQGTDSEQILYIPWRVGSERHLGILRPSGSNSMSSPSEPPPAYH